MQHWSTEVRDVVADYATVSTLRVWIIVTLVVALAGPFGTYAALSFGLRLIYWGGISAVSIMLACACRALWRVLLRQPYTWSEDALVSGTLGLSFGPFVTALNTHLWPGTDSLTGWTTISAMTFLIGVTVALVRRSLRSEQGDGATQRDRLLDRIGAPDGSRIGWVSSDNHHIVVKLFNGEEYRVLMRLRDAVADIDVEPGVWVHRSHWLALAQITDIDDTNGREVVQMPCGSQVPVGPKYRANLVEAGMVSE